MVNKDESTCQHAGRCTGLTPVFICEEKCAKLRKPEIEGKKILDIEFMY